MNPLRLLAVGALMSVVLSAPCGGLPCAADMPDVDEFHGGGMLPSARIPCQGGDIILDPSTNSSFKGLVLIAVDGNDLFTSYMTSDKGSLSMFFNISSRPDVPMVFASWNNQTHLTTVQAGLEREVSAMNSSEQLYWKSHLKFASQTVNQMLASDPSSRDPTKASTNVVPRILKSKSFISVRKHLSIWDSDSDTWFNVTRLDGFFQFVNTQDLHNHSPVNPISSNITKGSVQIACSKNNNKGSDASPSAGIILLLEDELTCSNEEAVQNYASQSGVNSVVIMAKKSTPNTLSNIGEKITSDDESAFGIVGTMVAYNSRIVSLLSSGKTLPSILEYTFGRGQYMSISHDFKLLQIGSPINPILAVVSWQAEYLNYLYEKKQLEDKMANTYLLSHRISVFEAAQGSVYTTGSIGAKSNFVVPAGVGTVFNRAMVSVDFGCPGNGDLECPIWDRIATVSAQCDTYPNTTFELTRWITPYRRSIGQWNTDISHYINYFSSSKPVNCAATLTGFSFGGMSEPWLSTVTITLYKEDLPPTANIATGVHKLPFTGGSYDVNYNSRAAPAHVQVTPSVKTVKLTALITGHGSDNYNCCEFLPTKHIFEVNGLTYNVSFMDPLDKWGCTRKASLGVEPNGYGAWWFGRNGWCNGDIVHPVIFTAPVSGPTVTVTYKSLIYNTTTKGWNSPPCVDHCGNIDLTSYITEYTHDE